MIHNERGLRVSGEPVKRHIVRVEVDVEVTGKPNKDDARAAVEAFVAGSLYTGVPSVTPYRVIGRPNAKRATVAPDAS